MGTDQEKEFYTTEEVLQSIEAISKDEMNTILRLARWRVYGLPTVSSMDLFQEAIRRILTGKRPWPKNVDFLTFISGVFRSMVNAYWRKHYNDIDKIQSFDESTYDEESEDSSTQIPKTSNNPEKELELKEFLNELERLFDDDDSALTVFMAQQDGYKASEIKQDFNLNDKEYETITRRIRRKLAKFSTREVENA